MGSTLICFAAAVVAIFISTTGAAAAAAAAKPQKCIRKCCSKVEIVGYIKASGTGPEQNLFPVVPGEVAPPFRNGYGATFGLPLRTGLSPTSPQIGVYSGTFHVTSGNKYTYQSSDITFNKPPVPGYEKYDGSVFFAATYDITGNHTEFTVLGGSKYFQGVTGTVVETNSDGVTFRDQLNLVIESPC